MIPINSIGGNSFGSTPELLRCVLRFHLGDLNIILVWKNDNLNPGIKRTHISCKMCKIMFGIILFNICMYKYIK